LDKKKSILIVDDDKAVLGVIKDILELQGYRVDTAETGQEALEKTKTRYYNLALLDIKLPDIEGTQLLTKMHRDIPKMMKIMITGYASLENAVESLNLGADAYLMKPIEAEKMLKVVEDKLKVQEEAESMSQEKVTEWIKSRIRKIESTRD
jgi:DNA-binding NtrC family response regulator